MKKIFLYSVSLVVLAFLVITANSAKSSDVDGDLWILANDTDIALVPLNSQVTLQWGGTYISSCQGSGDWSGSLESSGTKIIKADSDKNYQITCYDYSGDHYIMAQTFVDAIVCSDYTTMEVCLNDTLGECNWENKKCIPKGESQQTEFQSSVTAEPTLSVNTAILGTQLKFSGTFTGAVAWSPTQYCFLVEPTGVKYQIDNGVENTLSCWGPQKGGSIATPQCSNSYCYLCTTDYRCEAITTGCLWSHDLNKCIIGTTKPTCDYSTVTQYAITDSCAIDISTLSKSRHTLKLKFNFPDPVGVKTVSKTFLLTSSGGSFSTTTPRPTSTATPVITHTPTPTPIAFQDLSIDNYVSSSYGWYANNTSAKPGETISFLLKVAGTGNVAVDSVTVKSSLPDKLVFQSGTLEVDGESTSGDLFGSGLNLGIIAGGEEREITFDAVVANSSQFTAGTTESLNSSASVSGVGVVQETASAVVRVGLTATKGLSFIYTMKDVTSGSDYSASPEVAPGDTVEFKLQAGATGSVALESSGIAVNSSNIFEYVAGSTKIDGVTVADGVMGSGISLGTISAGKNKVVTFSAKISTNYDYDYGSNFFQNSAHAYATGLSQYDSIEVNVNSGATTNLGIILSGKNLSNNQAFSSSYVSAYPGQIISFVAEIEAPGDEAISNVVVKAVLPSRLKYVSGSTTWDGEEMADGIVSSGINIGDVYSDDTVTIAFNAEVSAASAFSYGKTTLWSKVTAVGSGASGTQSLAVYVSKTNPANVEGPSQELLAYNETKNQDATMVLAEPGDVIDFYLISRNNNSIAIDNYEVKSDLSGVLGLASVTYNGGGSVADNQIIYPAVSIASGATISKEFKIKIKEANEWGDANQIVLSYGNQVIINLEKQIIVPDPQMELVMDISNLTSVSSFNVNKFSLASLVNASESEVKASANDQLQMKVDVTNTGLVAIGNVRVVESLPDKINYVSSNESGEYNSLTSEIVWDLGVLLPDETKTLTLLASVANDVFVPSVFTLEARAEASTGIKDLTISSNPVKATIKNFVNPYAKLIKLLIVFVGLIVVGVLIFIFIKKKKNKQDGGSDEFAVV